MKSEAGDGGGCASGEAPADAREGPVDEDTIIHRNFTLWSSAPPSHLSYILTQLEPVALSRLNQRAMVSRNRRLPDGLELCKILEYVTNKDASCPIGENRSLAFHVNVFQDLSLKYGRRGRDLPLPPQWSTDGHYITYTKGNTVWLYKRTSDQSRQIDMKKYKLKQASSLHVVMNWSENRAQLHSFENERLEIVCKDMFPEQVKKPESPSGVKAPPAPRKRSLPASGQHIPCKVPRAKVAKQVKQITPDDSAEHHGLGEDGYETPAQAMAAPVDSVPEGCGNAASDEEDDSEAIPLTHAQETDAGTVKPMPESAQPAKSATGKGPVGPGSKDRVRRTGKHTDRNRASEPLRSERGFAPKRQPAKPAAV